MPALRCMRRMRAPSRRMPSLLGQRWQRRRRRCRSCCGVWRQRGCLDEKRETGAQRKMSAPPATATASCLAAAAALGGENLLDYIVRLGHRLDGRDHLLRHLVPAQQRLLELGGSGDCDNHRVPVLCRELRAVACVSAAACTRTRASEEVARGRRALRFLKALPPDPEPRPPLSMSTELTRSGRGGGGGGTSGVPTSAGAPACVRERSKRAAPVQFRIARGAELGAAHVPGGRPPRPAHAARPVRARTRAAAWAAQHFNHNRCAAQRGAARHGAPPP